MIIIFTAMHDYLHSMEEESCPLLEHYKKKSEKISEIFQTLDPELQTHIFSFFPGNHPFLNKHFRRHMPTDEVVKKICSAHQHYIIDEMRKIQQEYESTENKNTYFRARGCLVEKIENFMRTTRYDHPCAPFSQFWKPMQELARYLSTEDLSKVNKKKVKSLLQRYTEMANEQMDNCVDVFERHDCQGMHCAILDHHKRRVKGYPAVYNYDQYKECCRHSKNLLAVFTGCFFVGSIIFTGALVIDGSFITTALSSYAGTLLTFSIRGALVHYVTGVEKNVIRHETNKRMVVRHLKRIKNSMNVSINELEEV